jgi:DNA polymerase-3 subunit epsilon
VLFHSPAWDSVTYWALDIETGGLDARRDPIIAVGMLPVRGGIIKLGEAYQTLVRPEDGREIKPESVRAHQLLKGEVSGAPPLPEVLAEVEVWRTTIAEGGRAVQAETAATSAGRQPGWRAT